MGKSIDTKIAESEAEWRRYGYENMGVRESAALFYAALKKSAGKRLRIAVRNLCPGTKTAVFKPAYDENRENIVISLTSTADRIRYIFPPLYSLMAQSRKPDLIVLWLGKKGTYDRELVRKIRAMGITVRFREELGSYTKYYHAFAEYGNDVVITADDDIYYHEKMTEELYGTYLKHPETVIARRVNKMRFDTGEKLVGYKDWIWEYRDADVPAYDLLATGVGGVLYPPKVMALKCWESKEFLRLCPSCDDIWLKFCQLSVGIKVCAVRDSLFNLDVPVYRAGKKSLSFKNVDKGGNDEGIRACAEHFGMRDDLCERMLL